MKCANFEIASLDNDCVLIRDIGPWDQYLTVTNAVEEVVANLLPILCGRRLEYIDSEGKRDQILVEDGKFAGFAPAGDGR